MDSDINPLHTLLQKVDFILRIHGEDPDKISEDDKLALAIQYVEVAFRAGLTVSFRTEIYRL